MKRSLSPLRDALLILAATAASALALDEQDWKYRQPFELERAGIVKVAVPLETLDKLEPDLRDLRLVGPDGAEVPYALVRPLRQPARWLEPKHTQIRLEENATVVELELDPGTEADAVELATTAHRFLKPVRIERSDDGGRWSIVAEGVPFFRQDGAQQTALPLPGKPTARLRLTVGDRNGAAIPITGARLRVPAAEEVATESLPIRISRTETYASETVVTLDLPAANLELQQLQLQTPDVLFTRRVRAGYSRFVDGGAREETVSTDTVFRVALDGAAPTEKTAIAVAARIPSRELLLHIENGDSPPLRIDRIDPARVVTFAVFAAPAPGRYECWSGNARANAPRYDVAALAGQVRQAPRATLAPQPLSANPRFRTHEPLAGVVLQGGAIDASAWKSRRAVRLEAPGVHRLELDLAALSTASRNLGDVRLARGGRQIPYLVEHTALQRSLTLTPQSAPDRQRPTWSRWKIDLPRAGARLSGLVLQSPTRLFERRIRVLERRTYAGGEIQDNVLAEHVWRRLPQDKTADLTLPLPAFESSTLWVETDNGDNPAIDLDAVRGLYPVSRLIFRAEDVDGISLLTGNAQAGTPRYDLDLVAGSLLASEKLNASLSADDLPPEQPAAATRTTVIFWAALAVAVVALLAVVAKLLPKPPAK